MRGNLVFQLNDANSVSIRTDEGIFIVRFSDDTGELKRMLVLVEHIPERFRGDRWLFFELLRAVLGDEINRERDRRLDELFRSAGDKFKRGEMRADTWKYLKRWRDTIMNNGRVDPCMWHKPIPWKYSDDDPFKNEDEPPLRSKAHHIIANFYTPRP